MEFIKQYLVKRKIRKLNKIVESDGGSLFVLSEVIPILHTLYPVDVPIPYAERTFINMHYDNITVLKNTLRVALTGLESGTPINIKGDYSHMKSLTVYDFCALDNHGNYIAPSGIIPTLSTLIADVNYNLSSCEQGSANWVYYSRVFKYITNDLLALATSINGVKNDSKK